MLILPEQVSDQLGSVRMSHNFKYCATDTVSSVAWNPVMSNLASVTCDTGYLHTFDPRVSNDRRTCILAVSRPAMLILFGAACDGGMADRG